MAHFFMCMRNKISITGDLGSGKSAVGKLLSEYLQLPITSTGSIQRDIAKRMGMTTLELNHFTDTHPEIDDEIDSVFKSLRTHPDAHLLDSRLAWFFIPDSFKVYLQVDIRIAAQRVMGDTARKSESYHTMEEAIADLRARKNSENQRFLRVYNADCARLDNFDFVINTSFNTPEEIAKKIIEGYSAYQNGNDAHAHWVSPHLLKSDTHTTAEGDCVTVTRKGDDYVVVSGGNLWQQALDSHTAMITITVISLP